MKVLTTPRAASAIGKVALISAPLGVMLDNQHGLFNVLNYAEFGGAYTISFGETLFVKSAIWVPFLFAIAGLSMSSIQLLADELLPTQSQSLSWPKTFLNIGLFSLQYYISGALDFLGVSPLLINAVLTFIALAGFLMFDGSSAGLFLAIATAVAGPTAEIVLINGPHLYTYTHADILGICSWIPAVYFLGGSAVGNLTRMLASKETKKISND